MIINKKFNNYIITNNFVLWLKKLSKYWMLNTLLFLYIMFYIQIHENKKYRVQFLMTCVDNNTFKYKIEHCCGS